MVTTTSAARRTEASALTPDQMARVQALGAAREILIVRTGSAVSFNSPALNVPSLTDIHSLAQYILDGETPFVEYRAIEEKDGYDPLWALFDNGDARVDDDIRINLRVKAQLIEHNEPELALWLAKLAEAVAPGIYSPVRLASLRAKLTGDGYPPADVSGVPWADSDPDRTEDLTGETLYDPESEEGSAND